MGSPIDIDDFIEDYCTGVKDREILEKHGLSPKEFLGLVKKLMNEGVISRNDYFNRNKKIEEKEAKQEKAFLQSLYHCPICSHIHPAPFTICPACGANIAEQKEEPSSTASSFSFDLDDDDEDELGNETSFSTTSESKEEPEREEEMLSKPVTESRILRVLDKTEIEQGAVSLPEELFRKIGMELENIQVPSRDLSGCDYHITDVVNSGHKSAVFKAEDNNETGPALAIKVFHNSFIPEELLTEFILKLTEMQSVMNDENVLSMIGTCVLDGQPAVIYDLYSKTFADIVAEYPSGLPLDCIDALLPQILNGLGYSHMHRGLDGIVRRLPHMNLKLAKFLISSDHKYVKLEDCGLWSALINGRGHKSFLWEEPGAEYSALAPESFVIESKFLNAFQIDMYALGTVLYKLATGKDAFVAGDAKEYGFLHLKTFPVPPRVHRWDIPGWLDAMILKCLHKEPTKRWRSATQMELAIGKGLYD